jgi:D-serine deaminase-like pyridoxal phosphate-dependent protein
MKQELDTPALLVDLDLLEANLDRMASNMRQAGVKLRPHIKTHKCPAIAHMQLARGASGIAAAKLSEAEVMANCGLADVFIANQIIGDEKIKRLIALSKRIKVSSAIDSIEGAQMQSQLAQREAAELEVIIELDIGGHRAGVALGEPMLRLAQAISELPNLRLAGIMGYRGALAWGKPKGPVTRAEVERNGVEEGERMAEAAQQLRQAGFPIEHVMAGSTATAAPAASVEGITEVHPGEYVFYGMIHVNSQGCSLQDCALTLLTTVTSRPHPERAVVDAGVKAFAGSLGPQAMPALGLVGHGYVKELPQAEFGGGADEHGMLILKEERRQVSVGERMEIIPNHVCPVVNLFDELIGMREGRVEVVWPVLARGKTQ